MSRTDVQRVIRMQTMCLTDDIFTAANSWIKPGSREKTIESNVQMFVTDAQKISVYTAKTIEK